MTYVCGLEFLKKGSYTFSMGDVCRRKFSPGRKVLTIRRIDVSKNYSVVLLKQLFGHLPGQVAIAARY